MPPSFSLKLPAEKVVLIFSFIYKLPPGVTLTGTPTVTITVVSGTDPDPDEIQNGAPQIDPTSTQILVPVQAGLNGVRYQIEVECDSTQNTFLPGMVAILPVGYP